mgnify:CR=1 FL=1
MSQFYFHLFSMLAHLKINCRFIHHSRSSAGVGAAMNDYASSLPFLKFGIQVLLLALNQRKYTGIPVNTKARSWADFSHS